MGVAQEAAHLFIGKPLHLLHNPELLLWPRGSLETLANGLDGGSIIAVTLGFVPDPEPLFHSPDGKGENRTPDRRNVHPRTVDEGAKGSERGDSKRNGDQQVNGKQDQTQIKAAWDRISTCFLGDVDHRLPSSRSL